MRPTLSELGEYDGTALMEFKTRKNIVYHIDSRTACTYDVDDTPPFPLNREALDIAIRIALLSKLNIVGEVHITRKQYLDGSIPTGFQRTAIIGVEGEIPAEEQEGPPDPAVTGGGFLPRGVGYRPSCGSTAPTDWACR